MLSYPKYTKKINDEFLKLVEENKLKYKKGDKLFCKKNFKIEKYYITDEDMNFIKNKIYIVENIICTSEQFVVRIIGESYTHPFSVDPDDMFIDRRKFISDYFLTMKESRKLKLKKLTPFYKRIFKIKQM